MALGKLHAAAGSVAAVFTPIGGEAVEIRVIREQATGEVPFSDTVIPADTNIVSMQRSDVARPLRGDALSIGGEDFVIDGEPRLDIEGLSWSCELIPA